ncbi:MAG: LCP family protein [Candidatus Spechtbacterales bacterium]|nr:LCP family protein [Candidatus Spechtbacterales bacterium]
MALFSKIETSKEAFDAERKSWHKKRRFVLAGLLLFGIIFIAFFMYQTSNVLTIAGNGDPDVGIYQDFKVEKEPNRIDVLVLGIRGSGDSHGGLLSDTMLLFSFNKDTKKASLLSIPRDLYVEMPNHPQPEKINFAYALGEQRKPNGGGLALSKEVVKYVTGVYVDHAAVVNFNGFTRLVDIMGGVEIYRDTDFYESRQWQGEGDPNSSYWYKATEEIAVGDESENRADDSNETIEDNEDDEDNEANTDTGENTSVEDDTAPTTETREYWVFHVPKGRSVLDGEEALYYVRSRYSSSDFDRARRQQQVIESLKDKALSLGILGNPIKVFDIMDAIGSNVRTDMGLGDIRELLSIISKNSDTEIKSIVLDTSQSGMLTSSVNSRGQYVLLPKAGNFEEIRNLVRNALNE